MNKEIGKENKCELFYCLLSKLLYLESKNVMRIDESYQKLEGGKIEIEVKKQKKIRRMRILSTVFFLSFLAGTFKEMKRT